MDIVGQKPSFIFNATITGRVIVATGYDHLVGMDIDFPFGAIEWDSRDCEEGGVAISMLGHTYTVVDMDSMIITSLDE